MLHPFTHVFTYAFGTLSVLQSLFIKKGFKKTENSEKNVVFELLLLFLFTVKNNKQEG